MLILCVSAHYHFNRTRCESINVPWNILRKLREVTANSRPHSSRKLWPLDDTLMGPVKSYYLVERAGVDVPQKIIFVVTTSHKICGRKLVTQSRLSYLAFATNITNNLM
ncbi:hypothetical protein PV325_012929 [Microctonus aethiopoides]|nr:hypothetical protein PV325_012929 [Microctonus aethiopoides]